MKKLLFLLLLSTAAIATEKVLCFAGSVRKDSFNKALLEQAAQVARKMGAEVTIVDLKDYPMPFYDADLEREKGMPESAKALRALLISHQTIMIASPEYNGSIPALLKNTLDWASRSPQGGASYEAFRGKKFALVSASPGRGGGARALSHLRSILENMGANVISSQFCVPNAYESLSSEKKLDLTALKEEVAQLIH